jgi:acyl carrier protein
LQVGKWLGAQGARHLALVGRRAPGPEAENTIAALREQGVDVRVLSANIASPADVARILATITTDQPLRGVFHAAGVLDDGVLAQQSWERFARVFAPKVDGAWLLDQQTRGMGLDMFVLFSSAAALLGAPGQANYAAANAVLDALAQRRRAAGEPALSINWGAWSEVGMAAAMAAREQQRTAMRGMGSIAPAEGLQALELLLRQDEPQVGVLPMNWPILLAQIPADNPPPLLEVLARLERRGAASTGMTQLNASFADTFAATAPEERAGLVVAEMQRQVAEVLGIGLAELPNPIQTLSDLGLDSLMAVELKNRVQTRLGVIMPVAAFLEGPSITELAQQIADRLVARDGAAEQAEQASLTFTPDDAQAQPVSILTNLDQLHDDEVDEMLQALLAERGSNQ